MVLLHSCQLIEQHRHGRSSAWYWRQTISAIVISLVAEMWRHKLLALWIPFIAIPSSILVGGLGGSNTLGNLRRHSTSLSD
jgi:hypothetical protein